MDNIQEIHYELKRIIEKLKEEQTKKWLTEKEAMNYLDVSKSTIQKYRREGLLPFSQNQNKIYFKSKDLDDFLEANYTGSKMYSLTSKFGRYENS